MDQSGHDPQTLLTCTFFFIQNCLLLLNLFTKLKKKSMKKLLVTQSILFSFLFFSQFANKRLKRIFAKPHYFIYMCLQDYHGYIMFTGLSCPECDADLNCVRNRTCSPGEVCMVRNRPFNVNCVKVIHQKTRSCKKNITSLNNS